MKIFLMCTVTSSSSSDGGSCEVPSSTTCQNSSHSGSDCQASCKSFLLPAVRDISGNIPGSSMSPCMLMVRFGFKRVALVMASSNEGRPCIIVSCVCACDLDDKHTAKTNTTATDFLTSLCAIAAMQLNETRPS